MRAANPRASLSGPKLKPINYFSFHQEMQKFYRGWLSSDVESLREGDAEEEPEDNLLYFSNSLLVVLHQVPTYYHYTL